MSRGGHEIPGAARAPGPDAAGRDGPDAREARADARLLLMVARARFRLGPPPFDLAGRLAEGAADGRLSPRTRRIAAGHLGRLRLAALAGPWRAPVGPDA